MSRVKKKLQSRRGASITFALLIFLVCAMVSSVVIVSATTAAGHMSSQAEMDERYYAVAEATQMLRSRIEGQQVKADEVEDVGDLLLKSVTKQVLGPEEPIYVFNEGEPYSVNGDPSGIACTITQNPINNDPEEDSYKLLIFKISATGGQNNKNGAYTLEVIFTPNIRVNGTSERQEVTWKLNSISKTRTASAS